MEFRWIALIALWTLLSGPAFYHSPERATGDDCTAAAVHQQEQKSEWSNE